MKLAKLRDGTEIFCIRKSEAVVLDHHIAGYLTHGITIERGDVVFDVGANIGLLGVRALQKYDSVRVFAFEPIPTIYDVLRANSERMDAERFTALPIGLGREPGTLTFTYYPNSPALSTSQPEMWDDSDNLSKAVIGSIKHPPPHMWWTKLLPAFVARLFARRMRQDSHDFECPIKTVSQIVAEYQLSRIDLLKIDCEGAELDVLLGIADADWPKIHKAVIEVHDIDGRLATVTDLLRQHGLSDIAIEQEKALEQTPLHNIYARRPAATASDNARADEQTS